MINIHVNAAYCLFDSFALRPAGGAELSVLLDGRPYKPVYKTGGWFVITDQPEGEHIVEFTGLRFMSERFEETFEAGKHIERSILLKPAAKYPFGGAEVNAVKFEAGGAFWCAAENTRLALKLSQTQANAGDTELSLFYADMVYDKLLLSGEFLLVDKEKSEICSFKLLEGGKGTLTDGLKNAHSRGVMLYQAMRFETDQIEKTARFGCGCNKVFILENECARGNAKKGVKLSEFELKPNECPTVALK